MPRNIHPSQIKQRNLMNLHLLGKIIKWTFRIIHILGLFAWLLLWPHWLGMLGLFITIVGAWWDMTHNRSGFNLIN